MKINSDETYLEELLNEIFHITFVKDLGVTHAEPLFHKMLGLLQKKSDVKKSFLKKVRSNLLSNEVDMTSMSERPLDFVDPDLVFFIAHLTRYEEFRTFAFERKENIDSIKVLAGNTNRDYADLLLDALDDDWKDRDFYNTLKNN